MGDHSAIEWTDATWNPTVGCDKVSAGCQRCYAITQAYRLEHGFKQPAYQGLTRKLPDGSLNWTGVVRTLPERLAIPLTWKKPARIFVDSMSDLFHEDVPDEFIDRVYAVMALTERHSYQVLTKRPERLRAYSADPETPKRIGSYMTLGTILMMPGQWTRPARRWHAGSGSALLGLCQTSGSAPASRTSARPTNASRCCFRRPRRCGS